MAAQKMSRHLIVQQAPNDNLENKLKSSLASHSTSDGYMVYDGDGEVQERTGSHISELIEFAVRGGDEKPIDYDMFRVFLIDKFNISERMLFKTKKHWIKL